MPTQSKALRLMLEAIIAMREAGYAQKDVQELAREAWEHLEGAGHQPPRLWPLHQLWPRHHRVVSLPVVHPGAGALSQVRQGLVKLNEQRERVVQIQ